MGEIVSLRRVIEDPRLWNICRTALAGSLPRPAPAKSDPDGCRKSAP